MRYFIYKKLMLTYNTQQRRLVLPEYGRNIQKMVDHCLSIEDRGERTRCAQAIVGAMANLFPELRSTDNSHKLWDHLMIMSDFRLDVDFPCEVIARDQLATQPERVEYTQKPMRMRHYGKIVQQMVEKVREMPEGPERDEVTLLIANQMKKQMLAVNPDGVEDARIFKDLADMTRGEIRLNPAETHLHEFKAAPAVSSKSKKKKRR